MIQDAVTLPQYEIDEIMDSISSKKLQKNKSHYSTTSKNRKSLPIIKRRNTHPPAELIPQQQQELFGRSNSVLYSEIHKEIYKPLYQSRFENQTQLLRQELSSKYQQLTQIGYILQKNRIISKKLQELDKEIKLSSEYNLKKKPIANENKQIIKLNNFLNNSKNLESTNLSELFSFASNASAILQKSSIWKASYQGLSKKKLRIFISQVQPTQQN
eukprot:TRINITY_DN2703_c0_g1_i4.p1 TRINITY_DN2703_c0_g1~~TRINITY_DN2703_c0_g1_i4.p1  ORF type:complete len:215 (+),score=27.32 TRINITY_DN2703_c0_g1_i4:52-696(+)